MSPVFLYCSRGEGDSPHTHLTILEALHCWGTDALYVVGGPTPSGVSSAPPAPAGMAAAPIASPSPASPVTGPAPRWPLPRGPRTVRSTVKQIDYIEDLDGDRRFGDHMTKNEASDYIDGLKSGRYTKGPVPPEFYGHLPRMPERPRGSDEDPTPISPAGPSPSPADETGWAAKRTTKVPIELLEMVPDGYFAVQMEEGAPVTFLRVNRPKVGALKGGFKIQTQHGDILDKAFVKWPSGKVSVYKAGIEEDLFLLISDYHGAARLYAKLRSRCARCAKALTDERSRKYSIGPECEKYWPWMIDLVDAEEG